MCFFADMEDDFHNQYLFKKGEKRDHYWRMITKKTELKRREAVKV